MASGVHYRRKECFHYLSAITPPRLANYTAAFRVPITVQLATNRRRLNYMVTSKQTSIALLLLAVGLVSGACAALQPPNAGGPGSSGPPYPINWTDHSQRRDAAVLALNRIAQRSEPGNLADDYLQPVTYTVKVLPAGSGTPLYLPKVGSNLEMNEDETREALRRFINDWNVLIGSNPSQLSLIEREDRADRTKIALYEQRAFRYPLRGDFGKLQIHFTADRRLLNFSSSCIPETERLQSALSGITPRLTADEAIKHVRDRGVRYTDSFGNQQNFNVPANAEMTSELVTYVPPAKPGADSLEIHVAWEVTIGNAPFKAVYIDAVNDEVMAVR